MNYNQYDNRTPRVIFRTTVIIHLALVIGQILFAATVLFINSTKRNLQQAGDNTFLYIVIALTFAGIFVGSFLYKQLIAKATVRPLLKEKLAAYQTALIIRCAFSQAACLFGIVAYMLSGNILCLLLAGLNTVYFIWIRPTKQKIEDELALTYEDKTELAW